MKTKILLGSIIVILLAVIGLIIGFNWDIVKARFKKEELYTEAEVESIKKENSSKEINLNDITPYTWYIVWNDETPEDEQINLTLTFKNDNTARWDSDVEICENATYELFKVVDFHGVYFLEKTGPDSYTCSYIMTRQDENTINLILYADYTYCSYTFTNAK